MFFPAAALVGIVGVAIALGLIPDRALPVEPSPMRLHAYEMIFGHVAAAFAGVLLTALPRWTGCRPIAPAVTLSLAEIGRAHA